MHPHLADPAKGYLDRARLETNGRDFLSLWARAAGHSIKPYAEAFLQLNIGSWYPDDKSHATIYPDVSWNDKGYLQTQELDIEGFETTSLLPGVQAFYEQICRRYMELSECARYISDEKVAQRRETADRLAREYRADGIIYEQMKYCDFWGFERALVSHIMSEEKGWPVLSIDRVYNAKASGQLRTRFQAFVESLEIKRIQKGGRS